MILQPGSRPVPNYPDYKLIRRLGAGGFGEVWHASGPGGVNVALKFIRLDSHLRTVELRSLELMKSIRHPNLVSLFGAWKGDNWLILAMELCDGSLQEKLEEALRNNLPGIPLGELLKYMVDAANGLDALNAKQVQHRDIKPANLLLLGSGLKVANFGLAKALQQTVASNSGAGTVAYLAPECFNGELTLQTDQYSLAVTYYHLRTGDLLFKGDQAQIMYSHLQLEPNLSDLPHAERIILAREQYIASQKNSSNYLRKICRQRLATWRDHAERGMAEAQWLYADCLLEGVGVTKNQVAAARWFRKAADQGFPLAQMSLANRYYRGEGVVQDMQEAIRWYSKAADQGQLSAQSMLRLIHAKQNPSAETSVAPKSRSRSGKEPWWKFW